MTPAPGKMKIFKYLIIIYCTLPTNLLRYKYGTNK